MCNSPIKLTTGAAVRTVPCGHCQTCARRRTMSWTLRLLLESTEHTLTDFVTLTYAPEMKVETLRPKDFELFIKRLRNATRQRVRYFCCGEYGGRTHRPHWHVLLFGARLRKRGLSHTGLWPFGHVHSGEIEKSSAQYVCRYTLKSAAQGTHLTEVRMSRRPGIGMNRLREIAAGMAQKVPDMEYFPPVMSYSGKSYWLDRHAYAAVVDAYLNAGGVLTYDVAPNNQVLEAGIKALPLETAAREYLKKTRRGSWITDGQTSPQT